MQSRLLASATLLLALTMAACGGSSFTPPPPPGNGPFSNASLSGSYAFTMTGNDANGFFFMRAGSLVADGKGNFTGIEDVNSGQGLFTAIAFNGTYTVGGDGRGTMTANAAGTTTYRLTVVSNTKALIIQNDSFSTASGNLTAQNTAAFNAGLGGDYAFDFSGVDSSLNPLSIVGAFTANTNLFQNFETDMNDAGSPTQNVVTNGNFSSVDPTTGRGTASIQTTLGNLTFAYYIVSATRAFFISTNPGATPAVSGTISTQQPPVGGFASGAFLGDYSFLISGSSPSGGIGDAGRFHADGVSAISAGVLDENDNGQVTPQPGGLSFSGTFTNVDLFGRSTITLNTSPMATFVFYLISPQSAVMQGTASGIVSNGSIQAQSGGPFSNASLKSHFALNMTGTGKTQINVNPGRFDLIGDLAFDGAGNITGAEFTNDQSTVVIPGNVSVTGTYTLAANGRGTLTLMPNGGRALHFAIHVPDTSTIYLQGTDMGAVIVGIASNQNF